MVYLPLQGGLLIRLMQISRSTRPALKELRSERGVRTSWRMVQRAVCVVPARGRGRVAPPFASRRRAVLGGCRSTLMSVRSKPEEKAAWRMGGFLLEIGGGGTKKRGWPALSQALGAGKRAAIRRDAVSVVALAPPVIGVVSGGLGIPICSQAEGCRGFFCSE